MDERFLENASALELLHRNAAIENASAGARPERSPLFDGLHCVETTCGDEIPTARLAMGRIRCVACQALKERTHATRP